MIDPFNIEGTAWLRPSISRIGMVVLVLNLLLSSCGQGEEKEEKRMTGERKEELMDSLVKANKRFSRLEKYDIQDYIDRRGWEMERTGTGLRYMIYHDGDGRKAEKGMVAKVNYRIELLSGKLCYTSDSTGPKEFLIGKDNVETGLHEGIQFMNVGDKARFIIPAHLGHGLLGDRRRIPGRATLVFDIELLELKQPTRRR